MGILQGPSFSREYRNTLLSLIVGVVSSIVASLISHDFRTGLITLICFVLVLGVTSVLLRSLTHRLEANKSIREYGIVNIHNNQAAAEPSIKAAMVDAKSIDILGIRGLGLLGLKDSVFRQAMIEHSGQVKLRVLLLNPDSRWIEIRGQELAEDASALRRGVLLTIDSLTNMKKHFNVDIEIRLYDATPVWRLLFIGNRLFQSTYTPSVHGHDSPVCEAIYSGPSSLYAGYNKQFTSLWDGATPSPSSSLVIPNAQAPTVSTNQPARNPASTKGGVTKSTSKRR